MVDLTGRRVAITGAGGGLGRDIALTCARAGAALILTDLDAEALAETVDAVRAQGGRAEGRPADLADPASIAAFGEALTGPLHGLVNNGAIATCIGGIPFEQIEVDSWDAVMRVNVRGTWLMIRALAPALRGAGSGRIVNLASDTALWGAPNLMSYVSSKGAVIAMTRAMARELGPDGIGITAVAPGILRTKSTEYVPRARHELYETRSAVPGPQGTEDVADVIAYLLTPSAITLTGQCLPADHGFHFN